MREPPHLSQLLGLTTKQENVNVKQLAFPVRRKDGWIQCFGQKPQGHRSIPRNAQGHDLLS
jgi:hypothetical protein